MKLWQMIRMDNISARNARIEERLKDYVSHIRRPAARNLRSPVEKFPVLYRELKKKGWVG